MSYFKKSADEAESAFYAAFENLDLELMRSTWLNSDQVYCIHPNGPIQEGLDVVMQQWAFIFQGAEKPEINYKVLQRQQFNDSAIHLIEETIGTGESAALILVTNIYKNTPEGWRLFAHHASLPPSGMLPTAGELH